MRLNYNGGLNATELEAYMSNHMLLCIVHVITYPRLNRDAGLTSLLVKGVPRLIKWDEKLKFPN